NKMSGRQPDFPWNGWGNFSKTDPSPFHCRIRSPSQLQLHHSLRSGGRYLIPAGQFCPAAAKGQRLHGIFRDGGRDVGSLFPWFVGGEGRFIMFHGLSVFIKPDDPGDSRQAHRNGSLGTFVPTFDPKAVPSASCDGKSLGPSSKKPFAPV